MKKILTSYLLVVFLPCSCFAKPKAILVLIRFVDQLRGPPLEIINLRNN